MSEQKTKPVYKRLDQLIALAKSGKKFEAYNRADFMTLTQDQFITAVSWSTDAITGQWEYEEIKEPCIVEFTLDCQTKSPTTAMDSTIDGPSRDQWKSLRGKKWKVTCVEVKE